MTTLTVADYADTGQWRLIVNIYTNGMTALLENTLHADMAPQQLFSSSWEVDSDTLLHNIENAVYDNPRVLDDFSARILLFDRRTIFIPTKIVEESEGVEEEIYTALYRAERGDVISETDRDLTAVSSLVPGLKGFLNRTFPGARVSTNLMHQVSELRKHSEKKGKRMVVTARPEVNEADFILLDGENLITASTHTVKSDTDVTYYIYNIIDSYGIDPCEVDIPEKYQ